MSSSTLASIKDQQVNTSNKLQFSVVVDQTRFSGINAIVYRLYRNRDLRS